MEKLNSQRVENELRAQLHAMEQQRELALSISANDRQRLSNALEELEAMRRETALLAAKAEGTSSADKHLLKLAQITLEGTKQVLSDYLVIIFT